MSKVSVIIPSRSERFLPETVANVLSAATGEIEVIVVLDGYWPDPPLPAGDTRLKLLHRGTPQGMRAAINDACDLATGDFLMKLDAHCALPQGYDDILKADCDEDWVVIPRRHRLDPITWTCQEVGKPPIDYHYLSYPYERPGDPKCGLHGTIWPARTLSRSHILIDDEMSSQGSCWFMSAGHWRRRLRPLDVLNYGPFFQEFQEIGLKTWLGGGAVKVNKRTWYAHLHKGPTYGRGYSMSTFRHAEVHAWVIDYWMHNRWPQRVHDMRWLIEKFAPVPSWPGGTWADPPIRVEGRRNMTLEIVKATYGVEGTAVKVDVTAAVKACVTSEGTLDLKVGNAGLVDTDPAPGTRKRLDVTYRQNGVEGHTGAAERKTLHIG